MQCCSFSTCCATVEVSRLKESKVLLCYRKTSSLFGDILVLDDVGLETKGTPPVTLTKVMFYE